MRAIYGLALIALEDYEEAERQLQKSLKSAEQMGNSGLRGEALAYVASLHNARGNPDQAIQAAQASLPLAREAGNGRAQGHALFTLVDAYAAKHDWAGAEQAYQEAIRLAEQLSDDEMLSQARQGYADFLARQARFQEAYKELALVDAGAS
jgi:tetratricopeptide (TPR) repeat protein